MENLDMYWCLFLLVVLTVCTTALLVTCDKKEEVLPVSIFAGLLMALWVAFGMNIMPKA